MAKLGEAAKLKEALKKPAKPKNAFKQSWEKEDEYHQFMLISPPGNGKTVCAATLSNFIPETLPAEEKVELNDVAYLLFDTGGLLSLRGLNLSVPHIDLSRAQGESLRTELAAALSLLKEKTDSGEIKTIVVDTLTSLDKALLEYFSTKYEKFQIYSNLLSAHRNFFHKLKALSADVVYLVHPKTTVSLETDAQATKKAATDLPGMGDVRPDITGQAANFYIANLSFLLPIFAQPVGKGKFEYKIYPYGSKSFQAKTRIKLPTVLPANLKVLKEHIKGER